MLPQADRDASVGLVAGIGAFLLWGIAPLYFKLLGDMAAPEILAHRSIWSCVLAVLVLAAIGKIPGLLRTLGDRQSMAPLLISTLLIGGNWLVFIWAITHQRVLEASLGYYINPLINIVLGVTFLGERLRSLQVVAICLASVGIGHELWQFGSLPLVALFLALSFGFYGLVRKRAQVSSLNGLAVETLLMLPFAIVYLSWTDSATSSLTGNSWRLNTLLLLAGPVTLIPLLLFNIAARRLNLSTVGFLQYLGPTLMLLLAAIWFGEPFSEYKLVTFVLVWCGLAFYTVDAMLWRWRMQRHRQAPM